MASKPSARPYMPEGGPPDGNAIWSGIDPLRV